MPRIHIHTHSKHTSETHTLVFDMADPDFGACMAKDVRRREDKGGGGGVGRGGGLHGCSACVNE